MNFLDVTVGVNDDNTLFTDLFVKPTGAHMYVRADSCHPGHTIRSIPYAAALRILRICSDTDRADSHLTDLTDYLTNRGHGRKKVLNAINRAKRNVYSPRSGLKDNNVFFVTQYHPGLPDIKGILNRYMPVLHQSSKLKLAVPSTPVLSFSQPPNLKQIIVRAKVSTSLPTTRKPASPCGSKRCQLCNIIDCSDYIVSNGVSHKCNNAETNCTSKLVVYAIRCISCNMLYVGKSVDIRKRMNNHKSALRRYSENSVKTECYLLYEHLKSCSSSQFNFQILEKLSRENMLDDCERKWIWKLKTVNPHGLNVDDGFSVQNKKARTRRCNNF